MVTLARVHVKFALRFLLSVKVLLYVSKLSGSSRSWWTSLLEVCLSVCALAFSLYIILRQSPRGLDFANFYLHWFLKEDGYGYFIRLLVQRSLTVCGNIILRLLSECGRIIHVVLFSFLRKKDRSPRSPEERVPFIQRKNIHEPSIELMDRRIGNQDKSSSSLRAKCT